MTLPAKQERGAKAYNRGLWAERLARWLLRAKLYRIVGERVKTRAGEVDIVARKGKTLVIVEVKARRSWDEAAEAVSSQQWGRLLRAAEILLAREPDNTFLRFDVIHIVPGRFPRHLPDAWRP
jgi:putative endonuclease